MKRAIFLIPPILVLIFISTSVFADKTLNKQHLNLKTRDGDKVNCILCHKKAGIEKKKGSPYKHLYNDRMCNGSGCHPLPHEK